MTVCSIEKILVIEQFKENNKTYSRNYTFIMMNKFILYLLLTCLSSSLLAKECTKQEAIESELTSAYIKTWQELESHFIKYAHCDDGAIAEGYSESVSTLMGTKWSEFLAYSMDEDFLNFVKKCAKLG